MAETSEQWKARMGIGRRSSVARIVGGPGTTRTTPVDRDDAPGIAGTTTEHWDGRRDVHARAMTVTINTALRAATHS